jgi:hypothetical protein
LHGLKEEENMSLCECLELRTFRGAVLSFINDDFINDDNNIIIEKLGTLWHSLIQRQFSKATFVLIKY